MQAAGNTLPWVTSLAQAQAASQHLLLAAPCGLLHQHLCAQHMTSSLFSRTTLISFGSTLGAWWPLSLLSGYCLPQVVLWALVQGVARGGQREVPCRLGTTRAPGWPARHAALPGAPWPGSGAWVGKGLHSEVRLAALYRSCPPWTVAKPGSSPSCCSALTVLAAPGRRDSWSMLKEGSRGSERDLGNAQACLQSWLLPASSLSALPLRVPWSFREVVALGGARFPA